MTSTLWKVPRRLINKMEAATGCGIRPSRSHIDSIRGYATGKFSPASKHAWVLDRKLRWSEGSNATRDDKILNQMTARPQVRIVIDRAMVLGNAIEAEQCPTDDKPNTFRALKDADEPPR